MLDWICVFRFCYYLFFFWKIWKSVSSVLSFIWADILQHKAPFPGEVCHTFKMTKSESFSLPFYLLLSLHCLAHKDNFSEQWTINHLQCYHYCVTLVFHSFSSHHSLFSSIFICLIVAYQALGYLKIPAIKIPQIPRWNTDARPQGPQWEP